MTIYQQTSVDILPVVRLELLSPVTKPNGVYADLYAEKRQQALAERILLIEIDFAPDNTSKASTYSYQIAVSDPRPSHTIYNFGVDIPIPTIEISLANSEANSIDFNAVYNRTFAINRYYATILVDYE